jgi:ketosteroid isomerase-like protein
MAFGPSPIRFLRRPSQAPLLSAAPEKAVECWTELTRDRWMKITKASSRTALRDIEELIAAGMIEQEEAGGRSTSYRLNRAGKVRERDLIENRLISAVTIKHRKIVHWRDYLDSLAAWTALAKG